MLEFFYHTIPVFQLPFMRETLYECVWWEESTKKGEKEGGLADLRVYPPNFRWCLALAWNGNFLLANPWSWLWMDGGDG